MFWEFHRHIEAYDRVRICQCTACKSAANLTLKVISHYGEFTTYNVKNFSKLIGKDIILAHQLLKNDIEHHEYWLVTDNLTQDKNVSELPEWINWNNSRKQTDNGEVAFQYAYLSPLKETIPPVPTEQYEISEKVKVCTLVKDYDAEINDLFFNAVSFQNRPKWQFGVVETDQISHVLPQVGTKHRCVLEKGERVMYTSNYEYSTEKIVYAETDEKKKSACYFTFEKIGENKTRFTVDLYLKKNPLLVTAFRLMMKKKVENQFRKSMKNLEKLVSAVKEPAEVA
jgi:hypothetical protein